jgi:hypothetical protein
MTVPSFRAAGFLTPGFARAMVDVILVRGCDTDALRRK